MAKPTITISVDLLAAFAKFAAQDADRPYLNSVVFREDEIFATDGHRMARMPHETPFQIAISRSDALAAVAAARTLSSKAQLRLDDRPSIAIAVKDDRAILNLGAFTITTGIGSSHTDHTKKTLNSIEPRDNSGPSPDGIGLDPRLFSDLVELSAAASIGDESPERHGLRVTKWGNARTDAMVIEGPRGLRVYIMPMRLQ